MLPSADQPILNLAREHFGAGRHQDAEPLYRRLLAAFPQESDLWHELGAVAWSTGRLHEARDFFTKAVALNPLRADYQTNLGLALYDLRQLVEAAAALEGALRLDVRSGVACYNLGRVRAAQQRWEDAVICLRHAIEMIPDYLSAYLELGIALMAQKQLDEAIATCRQGLAHLPRAAQLWNNLGTLLQRKEDCDGAAQAFEMALACDPNYAVAANNLAGTFQATGRLDDAIAWLRRSMALDPSWPAPQSNLIMVLQHHPAASPAAILAEARQWQLRFGAAPVAMSVPNSRDRSPERRLRLGYVSPDFRAHAVGAQMLPVLREHDREQFDIVCYSNTYSADEVTAQFRELATEWRETAGWDDERLAAQIVEDRIGILIDLALHTLGNRLGVFARRPAPVQITFAGYPGTTGLEAIDYRLTDRFLDPPGCHDAFYSEESIRLPDSFWCFEPVGGPPEVQPLPAFANGYIVFGSLVKFEKVNDHVLALWSRVLDAVPQSRLLLLCPAGSTRDRVHAQFRQLGIEASRVLFTGRLPLAEYYALHHRIDLILDTFPYNGHTTTLDALWMGVPVISLAGETAVSRGGLSILNNAGLPELATHSADEFIRCAAALATDLPRLSALRASLRDRLQSSPLMDLPRFTRGLELASRAIWRRWCQGS